MEMQQIMECLLARMGANTKAMREVMKTMQEEADAIHKETTAKIDINQRGMEVNRKTDRETMKQEIGAGQEQVREEIKSGQEEIRSIVNAWIAYMNVDCLETTTCHEETKAYTKKIQPDPRMLLSVVEYQDVPKEEAAVMPVGGLRKRCWDRNLAAGCCQKSKGRIQESCESQKRLTITSRKMACGARVAGCRENFVRKDRTRNQAERGTPKR
jgi:hypothetical protein